ncbi:hypothetical protein C8Q75DRAFT_865199 [Abortiporus biennis]|nr:hypothetical protein C8Q75DRAFT_865199 [Abortiporus biennis]
MSSSNFPPARPRERPVDNRESLLRASILETAVELGVGNNNTVAKWMFDTVDEGDEDLDSSLSPSLTYASTSTTSTANSDESSLWASASSHPHQPGVGFNGKSPTSLDHVVQYSHNDGLSPASQPPTQRTIHFDLSATPEPRSVSPLPPSKHKKLKKNKPDGYDSDGGYMSDGGKQKEKKKKDRIWRRKDKSDGNATEYESDGGYLSETAASMKKKKKEKEKKSKKDNSKVPDGTNTDYESDGGYMSVSSLGRSKKSKKQATTPSTPGDESDGAYMSESSTKKKRFFRLNSRSSKKKSDKLDSPVDDYIPPVPSLPSLPLPLPIAERFARSDTPNSMDTRTITPVPSERTFSSSRASDDTYMSSRTSVNSSLESPKGLTNAFKDAESVRSPSIDVLASFSKRALAEHSQRIGAHPLSQSSSADSLKDSSSRSPSQVQSSSATVPTIAIPKPKRNPSVKRTPQISAPNTSTLAATRHVPVPLILTPPTPANGLFPTHRSASSAPSPMESSTPSSASLNTPMSITNSPFDALAVKHRTADVPRSPSPHPFTYPSPLPSPLPLNSPVFGQSEDPPTPSGTNPGYRNRILGYYDLPPPSPPPSGPLPNLPPPPPLDDNPRPRSPFANGRLPGQRSASSDGIPTEIKPPSTPIWKTGSNTANPPPSSPYRSPSRAATSPAPGTPSSGAIPSPSTPLFLQRSLGQPQRGRESPFPTRPVLPKEESADLVRRTSVAKHALRPNSPNLAVPSLRVGHRPPLSASPYAGERDFQQQQLDAHWQPRSASALGTRRPSGEEVRNLWATDESVDYAISHDNSSPGNSSNADIDAVLDMLKDDAQRTSDEISELYGDKRSTLYLDDEEPGGRYSVWSQHSRPVSILDGERSANVREKLVKRVEAMYGKDMVPPVPRLPTNNPPREGMF